MLKHIYLNQKKVPVPVPLKNLFDTVGWIEKYMLRDGYAITKVILDGEPIDDFEGGEGFLKSITLSKESRLEFQLDSVQDISIQTIDALRNLTMVLGKSLKTLAVEFWKASDNNLVLDLSPVLEDMDLILDMIAHIELLLQEKVSTANVNILGNSIRDYRQELVKAYEDSDYKLVAKVMLKKIETPLQDLGYELSMLQSSILEKFADSRGKTKLA